MNFPSPLNLNKNEIATNFFEPDMSKQRQRQRRVVVAVDQSEESMYTLPSALQFLLFQGSKEDQVILLHAQLLLGVFAIVDGTGRINHQNIYSYQSCFYRLLFRYLTMMCHYLINNLCLVI